MSLSLLAIAVREQVELTVVGPELPLPREPRGDHRAEDAEDDLQHHHHQELQAAVATALLVANEANHERYPLNFADHAFHLGWAQLLLGWALRLGVVQLHTALHLSAHFPAAEPLRAETARAPSSMPFLGLPT